MHRLILAAIIAGTFVVAVANSAKSAVVTATFSGRVTRIDHSPGMGPPSAVTVGDAVTGTMVYDTALAAGTLTPPTAHYVFPTGAMCHQASIEGYQWNTDEAGTADLADESSLPAQDQANFVTMTHDHSRFPAGSLPGLDMGWVELDLTGDPSMLSSLALPITDADLYWPAVTYAGGAIQAYGWSNYWIIFFSIDQFSLGGATAVEGRTWGEVKSLMR
jgi:hypothetical protein